MKPQFFAGSFMVVRALVVIALVAAVALFASPRAQASAWQGWFTMTPGVIVNASDYQGARSVFVENSSRYQVLIEWYNQGRVAGKTVVYSSGNGTKRGGSLRYTVYADAVVTVLDCYSPGLCNVIGRKLKVSALNYANAWL